MKLFLLGGTIFGLVCACELGVSLTVWPASNWPSVDKDNFQINNFTTSMNLAAPVNSSKFLRILCLNDIDCIIKNIFIVDRYTACIVISHFYIIIFSHCYYLYHYIYFIFIISIILQFFFIIYFSMTCL